MPLCAVACATVQVYIELYYNTCSRGKDAVKESPPFFFFPESVKKH
jgi:hypothetical protein